MTEIIDISLFRCFEHDKSLVPVYIDEEGIIETDEYEMDGEPNGYACPEDDCKVVIYESDE